LCQAFLLVILTACTPSPGGSSDESAGAANSAKPIEAPDPGRAVATPNSNLTTEPATLNGQAPTAGAQDATIPPPGAGAVSSGETAAVLFRTYSFLLTPEAKMGSHRPPMDRFVDKGFLVGGQDGAAQLNLVWRRLTLEGLTFQYSDSAPMEMGGTANFTFNFNEPVRAVVNDLKRLPSGVATARFTYYFGDRQIYQRLLPVEEGKVFLFAGRLDLSLPILSAFTVEIGFFTPDQETEREDFLARSRADRELMTSDTIAQRSQEPFIPGVDGVSMPTLLSSTTPIYPEAAKPDKLDGQVMVEVVVDREGKVVRPSIITSSDPLFDSSALESAHTYVFQPAERDGEPVSVTMTLIMVFQFSTPGR